MNTIQIAGAVLLLFGVLMGAGTFLYGKWKNRKPTAPGLTVISSDAPAPVGISEYMALITNASPTATAEVRWEYAGAGLTEADVLRREVARLGEKKA